MSEHYETGLSATEGPLPDPVLLENGDVLVPVADTAAPGSTSVLRLSPEEDDYVFWLGRAQEAARRPSVAKPVAEAGRVAVLVGAVVLIASTFLPYLSFLGVSKSLWQGTTRFPLILTLLAAVAIIVIALSFYIARAGLILTATVVSFFLLGETFPLVLDRYPFDAGFWIGVVGAAIMCVGSVLVMALRSAAAVRAGAAPN